MILNNARAAGDFRMDSNDDPLELNTVVQFTGTAIITLIELDNGADESLGTVVASAAAPGVYVREFTDLPSFHYHLTYEVSA